MSPSDTVALRRHERRRRSVGARQSPAGPPHGKRGDGNKERISWGAHLGALAFVLAFAGCLLWWALGLGDIAWILAGVAMVITWAGGRRPRIPAVWILWGVYLAWVVATLVMVDTTGRMIGAVYRLLLMVSAGIFGVHVYNSRDRLPLRTLLVTMTLFLLMVSLGGYLTLAMPQLTFKTPLYHLVPQPLLDNDLVREIVIRRTSQWNPDGWFTSRPRPSAPFLYTNTWGNVYSLVFPLALVHLRLEWALRSPWRWPVAAVCAASIIPAVNTLNRGMFVGLIVVALWVGIQFLIEGKWEIPFLGVGVVAVGALAFVLTPVGAEFFDRVSGAQSTTDRYTLYVDTLKEVARSPILGWGAPRPAPNPWLPSLGTQGQFWTVLFSHGFVGITLFMGFLLWAFLAAWKRRDTLGAVLGGLILATLVETLFYGMMTGLVPVMVIIGLLMRGDRLDEVIQRRAGDWIISTRDSRVRSRRRFSTARRTRRG